MKKLIATLSILSFLIPSFALAATKFLEPGGDADFGEALWNTTVGTVTLGTDFVHGSHVKSLKFAPSTNSYLVASNVAADAGGRVSVWVYLNALPSATQSLFQIEQTGDGNVVLGVYLTSAGTLQFKDFTGAQIGTNGSTLSTGNWYRLSFAWTITSTTVNEFRLFKDGNVDISVTNGTINQTTSADLQMGNGFDTTMDLRMSDIYADNSTALTDPGNIWVTAKRPFSNGTSNQFTTHIGTGNAAGYGSGHATSTNERPASATQGWSLSNTAVSTEEYTIEGQSVGDINITGSTIVDYMGWIISQVNSTANTPVHHIIVGGTASSITEATSQKTFKAIAGSAIYPAGNTDIGMDAKYTTTPHLTSLFEAGIVVAYIPAAAAPAAINGTGIAYSYWW